MSNLSVTPALTLRDFGLVSCLRTLVFVIEQSCPPCDEFDETDDFAQHYLGWISDEPVTTCRVYDGLPGTIHIGRIVTAQAHRGKGYAAAMLRILIDQIRTTPGVRIIELSAQDQAAKFYEKMGFATIGDGYMQDGIPHHKMQLMSKREAA